MAIPVREPAEDCQRDRLLPLAESANETARMARVNVSLTLIAALYLTLTLLTATDENLLRNTAVTLPQLEIGISLETSFIFAPFVFLYLHAQTLFLLAVLARKVRRFEDTLVQVHRDDEEARNECRDWLSAVSLVQVLVGTGGFAAIARVFTWLGVSALPLLLLLLIDISFLRYQSVGITAFHHFFFCVDLAGVWVFWHYVRLERSHSDCAIRLQTPVRAALKLSAGSSLLLVVFLWVYAWPVPHDSCGHELSVPKHHPLHKIDGNLKKRLRNADSLFCPVFSWRGACRTFSFPGGTLVQLDSLAISSAGGEDPSQSELYRRLHGINLKGRSLRCSDLQDVYLVAARLAEADLRGANLKLANLTDASLVSANLERANLKLADLTDASLVSANLERANLERADLARGNLTGAVLESANLKLADLTDASLVSVNLEHANLEHANLRSANLGSADLRGADLTGANLTGANLMDADLTGAKQRGRWIYLEWTGARVGILLVLRDADLTDADLTDADLTGADLQDANLRGTNIQGADLRGSDLQDADLRGANLQDADLRGADLRNATVTQSQLDSACGDGLTRLSGARTILDCGQ